MKRIERYVSASFCLINEFCQGDEEIAIFASLHNMEALAKEASDALTLTDTLSLYLCEVKIDIFLQQLRNFTEKNDFLICELPREELRQILKKDICSKEDMWKTVYTLTRKIYNRLVDIKHS